MSGEGAAFVWAGILAAIGVALLVARSDARGRFIGLQSLALASVLATLAVGDESGAMFAIAATILLGAWIALALSSAANDPGDGDGG